MLLRLGKKRFKVYNPLRMNENLKKRLEEIEKTIDFYMSADTEDIRKGFGPLPEAVSRPYLENLINPGKELIKRGGKRWRPLLSVLSCELAGGTLQAIYPLTPLVELCHTASLIHDDIEDCSETRRGGEAIHIKYGEDIAINAGSWLYFRAAEAIFNSALGDKEKSLAYRFYIRNLSRLHLGQAMDIGWHSKNDYIPAKAEYEAMINLKTGSLARLAGEVGFIAAGKSEKEAAEYGMLTADIGVGFQILDDVKNIKGGIPGKEYGDDIVEGKKSLPVIFYLEENPAGKKELTALFKRAAAEGIRSSAVKNCIDILLSSKAVNRAEAYGRRIVETSLIKFQNTYGKNKAADLLLELFRIIL